MTRRKLIVSSIISFIVILFLGVNIQNKLADKKSKPKAKVGATYNKQVLIDTFRLANRPIILEAYGNVQANSKIQLTSEVQGKILLTKTPLKAGQSFKKGALLIHIDDYISRNAVRSLRSDFIKQVSGMLPDIKIDFPDNYESWLGFMNQLSADKNIPQLPKAKSNAEKTFVTHQQIYTSYYNILGEQDRLKKHRVYAPFSGSYSDVIAEVGMNAYPNMTMATIIKSDILEVEIPISTNELKHIKIGQPLVIISQNDQSERTGSITRISNFISSNTQSVNVYAKFKNSTPKLFDGSYVNCILKADSLPNCFVVPRKAVLENKFVYTLEEGRLVKTPIHVLFKNTQFAYINGLEEGVAVIVENVVKPAQETIFIGVLDTTANYK